MITGKNIDLRNVDEHDAEFILSLRLDPNLNKYISPVENDLVKQKEWIKNNKLKDKEYYFIVQNKKKEPVGTIRVYDIKGNSFCWGSWIIKPEARYYATLESIVRLYQFSFFKLGFDYTRFDVRKENEKALNFYLRFGAIIEDENDLDYFMLYKKENFIIQEPKYLSIIDNIHV